MKLFDPSKNRRLDKAEYVEKFMHWLATAGYQGWMNWKRIRDLSFEFSEYMDIQPLSAMSLSKELKRHKFARRTRYLKQTEREFRLQRDRGCQRPRELEIELKTILLKDPTTKE